MTKRRVQQSALKIIQGRRFSFNGSPVLAGGLRRVGRQFNSLQAYQGKCFLAHSSAFGFTVDGFGAGVEELQHFRVRTSPQTSQLRFVLGLVPITDDLSQMTSPRARARILKPSESKDDSTQLTGEASVPSGADINEVHSITWPELSIFVDPDTEYIGWIEVVDGQRLISCMGYEFADSEIDDANDGVVDHRPYVDEGPILDTHFSDLVHANNEIPGAQGAHLISWTREQESNAPTTTSGTLENIFDGSTTVGDATPGFIVDLTNRGDVDGNVKCRFAVRAEELTGQTVQSKVALHDKDDGEVASLTEFPNGLDETNDWGWKTADITLSAKSYKLDAYASITNDETLRIDAVYLYPHPHT